MNKQQQDELLERYGVDPRVGEAQEKYAGKETIDLIVKAIYEDLDTKADGAHKHAATDITEDDTHKFVTQALFDKISRDRKVYELAKADLNAADETVLTTVKDMKEGDLAIVKTAITTGEAPSQTTTEYEYSAYMYLGNKWVALSGKVDADKVIIRKDFLGAGDWDRIGNYTKGKTETSTIKANGISVFDFLTNMVTAKIQPKVTAEPAVSGFTLEGAKSVEVGTKIETAKFKGATLSAGSYTYGPATGVVAKTYKVDRICDPARLSKESVGNAAAGEDNNEATGFILGDDPAHASNVVKTLKYKMTIGYNEGVVAHDSTKNPSVPEVKIAAGNKSQETASYTCFRKYFYGATTDTEALTSDIVRGLTNSNGAYKPQTITVTVPAGSKRVVIATIGTAKGVTKVINKSAMNADMTAAFTQATLQVEGANRFKPVEYKVWTYQPAVPYENTTTLEVTLG